MTDQEKEMITMQKDIHDIKKEVSTINGKMEKVLDALIGNDLAKDGGIIKRIEYLEGIVDKMENSNVKNDSYLKLLWAAIGIIGTGIIMYLFNIIFKAK